MARLNQTTPYNRAFLLVQTADHISGLTAASTASIVVQGSKNAGAFTTLTAIISELGNGYYNAALKTSDVSILGDLAFHITVASADPTDFIDQVVSTTNTAVISQAFPSNFAALSISAAGLVALNSSQTVQTGSNLDKAGYSLTQAFPANFSSLSIAAAGTVSLNSSQTVQAGSVLDKAGYSLTQSFPANFAALAIIASGQVGINWGNIAATASINILSGTTINTSQSVVGGSGATVQQIVNGVWDEPVSAHTSPTTSMGHALSAAGSAGDPWLTALPGAYTSGQAGNIVGVNLNAPILSRMSSAQTVVVSANNDKMGYALSQAFPSNFASQLISAGGLVSINSSSSVITSAPVTVGTNNDKTGYALTVAPPTSAAITTALLTTQMTEAYAALHTVPSLAEALFEMRSMMAEKAVSGTSVTILQIDGATTAETFTLDSTSPSQIHRSS